MTAISCNKPVIKYHCFHRNLWKFIERGIKSTFCIIGNFCSRTFGWCYIEGWLAYCGVVFRIGFLVIFCLFVCLFLARQPPVGHGLLIHRFLDHTQRRTTVGRTPLDEWSARRRDLYLTTHNTRNRQTSMLPVGFEPTISAGERPQTNTLDRAATGTGFW